VEAREVAPPAGVQPLHWRLLTTLVVQTAEDAAEVVRLYRLRWRIEQTFRTLKSDGLKLEECQTQDPWRLLSPTFATRPRIHKFGLPAGRQAPENPAVKLDEAATTACGADQVPCETAGASGMDRQVAFQFLERLFNFDELQVESPQFCRIITGQIGPQQITAFPPPNLLDQRRCDADGTASKQLRLAFSLKKRGKNVRIP